MPELPEVEHVRKELQRLVAGRTIESARLLRPRLAPDVTPLTFAARLSNAAIISVGRRGKHLLLHLNNGRTLIVHLRMSGRFMLLSADDTDPKFTHAVFNFPDETRLVFQDQRHFGLMKIADTTGLFAIKELAKLAPEPFSEEFSIEYFTDAVRSSARTVKCILLDQTKVCGVGNIYASEALFLSRISPRRRGRSLGRSRCALLHGHVKAVLQEAIKMMETIVPDPVAIGEGVYGGGSSDRWLVYDNEGSPCSKCESGIKRIVQDGRSTYYCPKCQR